MAAHHSTAAANATNAGLTNHRFRIDPGPPGSVLINLPMSLATAELPIDPDALRAFALACQGELKAMQVKAIDIEKLRFQIAKLRRMQFGRSSEWITRQIEQLELQLEELETGEAEDIARAEASEPAAPIPVRAKPKRKPLPDHLPRHEVHRGGEHPASHMASFTGLLQADDHAGFEKLYNPVRTRPCPLTEVACWAHCRRGFFDEWERHKSPTAEQALDRIAAIYAIEARAAFVP